MFHLLSHNTRRAVVVMPQLWSALSAQTRLTFSGKSPEMHLCNSFPLNGTDRCFQFGVMMMIIYR